MATTNILKSSSSFSIKTKQQTALTWKVENLKDKLAKPYRFSTVEAVEIFHFPKLDCGNVTVRESSAPPARPTVSF